MNCLAITAANSLDCDSVSWCLHDRPSSEPEARNSERGVLQDYWLLSKTPAELNLLLATNKILVKPCAWLTLQWRILYLPAFLCSPAQSPGLALVLSQPPKPELTHACNATPWNCPGVTPHTAPGALHNTQIISQHVVLSFQGLGGSWQGPQTAIPLPNSFLSFLELAAVFKAISDMCTHLSDLGSACCAGQSSKEPCGGSPELPLSSSSTAQVPLQLWPCWNLSLSVLNPDVLTWLLGLTSDQVLLHWKMLCPSFPNRQCNSLQ